MQGQVKTAGKILAVLFASAALSVAQLNNNVSAPAVSPQNGRNPYYASQPPAPVGPGTINYVEGQASLEGQELSPRSVGATAHVGQVIDTGNGYLEVLLTPGAFLRIGPNSEVRMLSAGLADTRIELIRGSGLLEADQLIKGTNLGVALNGATTQIEKTGLYAFDASAQTVRVVDGKAKVAADNRVRTLDKHDQVTLTGVNAMKRKGFDANAFENEPLYVWSKARSEDEAQANLSAASNAENYTGPGSGWFWDGYAGAYGFWPAAGLLYSPFGWGFYSPAYFGYYGSPFGWYGGGLGYYGGRGWHGHPGAWHGRVAGSSARIGAFHGGFHGTSNGFHGGGFGGFHGGGGHR